MLITRDWNLVAQLHGERLKGQKQDDRLDQEIHKARKADSSFHACSRASRFRMLPDVTLHDKGELSENLPKGELNADAEKRIVDIFVWLLTNEPHAPLVDNDD
jgi:hypothetical protein